MPGIADSRNDDGSQRHERLPTSDDNSQDDPPSRAIRLTIPPRWYQLPLAGLCVGGLIGFVRGSRGASLRFLAENAHRAPRTVQGWYFYNKTKNYRVVLGGLKRGGKDAAALALTAAGWVGIEEGMRRWVGDEGGGQPYGALTEVAAGLGTAGVFCAVYRLPLKTARRAVFLGGTIGGLMSGLALGKGRLSEMRANLAAEAAAGEQEQAGSGAVAVEDDRAR